MNKYISKLYNCGSKILVSEQTDRSEEQVENPTGIPSQWGKESAIQEIVLGRRLFSDWI